MIPSPVLHGDWLLLLGGVGSATVAIAATLWIWVTLGPRHPRARLLLCGMEVLALAVWLGALLHYLRVLGEVSR